MWKISSLTNELTAAQSSSSATVFNRALTRIKRIEPLMLIWWCFALATLSGAIARFSDDRSGLAYATVVIAGSGACAWFWFLSRALFRDKQHLGSGIFSLVPIIIAIEATAALMPEVRSPGMATEAGRIVDNAASVACIAAIAFVWREALFAYSAQTCPAERGFRKWYVGSFSLLVVITLLWMSGANPGSFPAQWQAVLQTGCAMITLAIGRMAVHYRLKHPLSGTATRTQHTQLKPVCNDEQGELLAKQILAALKDDDLLTTQNLKIADLAERIGEQEYKVTRCITSHLQYRNFNHLINSYRIERAKRQFADPDYQHLNIASIAYDCGFNSLGPFNKAFRQHTGMTPRQFRQQTQS